MSEQKFSFPVMHDPDCLTLGQFRRPRSLNTSDSLELKGVPHGVDLGIDKNFSEQRDVLSATQFAPKLSERRHFATMETLKAHGFMLSSLTQVVTQVLDGQFEPKEIRAKLLEVLRQSANQYDTLELYPIEGYRNPSESCERIGPASLLLSSRMQAYDLIQVFRHSPKSETVLSSGNSTSEKKTLPDPSTALDHVFDNINHFLHHSPHLYVLDNATKVVQALIKRNEEITRFQKYPDVVVEAEIQKNLNCGLGPDCKVEFDCFTTTVQIGAETYQNWISKGISRFSTMPIHGTSILLVNKSAFSSDNLDQTLTKIKPFFLLDVTVSDQTVYCPADRKLHPTNMLVQFQDETFYLTQDLSLTLADQIRVVGQTELISNNHKLLYENLSPRSVLLGIRNNIALHVLLGKTDPNLGSNSSKEYFPDRNAIPFLANYVADLCMKVEFLNTFPDNKELDKVSRKLEAAADKVVSDIHRALLQSRNDGGDSVVAEIKSLLFVLNPVSYHRLTTYLDNRGAYTKIRSGLTNEPVVA
ncbi:MAG: hypothetical protein SGJ02_06405 [bacterium]|nr:hypothetical protein [bacterium]